MHKVKSSAVIFHLLPITFFLLFSFAITSSWFRSGLQYGGAEIGIFAHDPRRFLEIQQYIWWGAVAPGMLVPQFVVGVPLNFLLSFIQPVFSFLSMQILISFVLLFLMGYGMYLFSLSVLGKEKIKYALFAAFFYMVNSYTMVEIWHRFLYTGFFLAASLPIITLFWKLWIEKNNFSFLTLFLLANLSSSYMFGNLTSFIVIWIICFMMTLFEIFSPWKGKKVLVKISYKFTLGFLLFLLTNLWWLIPVFRVSTGVLPEQHSSEDNINTLVTLGKQTILPYTLQYANPFYLFNRQELGQIYISFVFLILPWIPILIIFIGLLTALKKKYLANYSFAYLFAILISKGIATPFGYVFIWLLTNIYILGVLRNPFEKLGILLPFLGSILFAVGIETLSATLSKRRGSLMPKIIVIVVLISLIIYGWPIFSNKVFDKQDYPLSVKVPETYTEADNWLKSQKKVGGNILHLPLPIKGVLTYNWDHGYHGVEINEILFTSYPSITRNVGFKRVDDSLMSLSFIFNKPFSENKEQILKLLQDLDVRFIILHKDTKWDDVPTYGKDIRLNNPTEIESSLVKLSFLEKPEIFGKLVIYKLKDNYYQQKINFEDHPELISPGETDILQILRLAKNNQMVTKTSTSDNTQLNISKLLIFPDRVLYNWEPTKSTLESLVNASLLDSQLKRMEKTFHDAGVLPSEKLAKQVIVSTDILFNLNQPRINGQNDQSVQLLDNYMNAIDNIFSHQFMGSNLQMQYKDTLSRVFRVHLYILRQAYENLKGDYKSKAKKVYDTLNSYLVNNYLLPIYILDENNIKEEVQRRVHRFDLQTDLNYELLLNGISSLSLYPDVYSKLNIQVDGKDFTVKVDPSTLEKDDATLLGNIILSKGVHEISYNVIPSLNTVPTLISNADKYIGIGNVNVIDKQYIKLSADSQIGALIGGPLSNITGGDSYEISFEAATENVNLFYLDIPEDTESTSSIEEIGKQFTGCNKSSCYVIRAPSNNTGWQNYSITTTPLNLATRQAFVRIILPTNTFNISSTMQIKNLKVNRIMSNNLILRKISEDSNNSSSARLIDIKEINPTSYEGKIKIEKPTFMFFKETFNPNWILKLKKDSKTYIIDKHYLGNLYGNAYFIDKMGEYNFSLNFDSQKTVDEGITLSLAGWIIVLGLLLYSEYRKK